MAVAKPVIRQPEYGQVPQATVDELKTLIENQPEYRELLAGILTGMRSPQDAWNTNVSWLVCAWAWYLTVLQDPDKYCNQGVLQEAVSKTARRIFELGDADIPAMFSRTLVGCGLISPTQDSGRGRAARYRVSRDSEILQRLIAQLRMPPAESEPAEAQAGVVAEVPQAAPVSSAPGPDIVRQVADLAAENGQLHDSVAKLEARVEELAQQRDGYEALLRTLRAQIDEGLQT